MTKKYHSKEIEQFINLSMKGHHVLFAKSVLERAFIFEPTQDQKEIMESLFLDWIEFPNFKAQKLFLSELSKHEVLLLAKVYLQLVEGSFRKLNQSH